MHAPDRTFREALDEVVLFCSQREWSQFHELPRVASALSIETAEILEIFRWQSDSEARAFVDTALGRDRLAQEIADVFIYALLMCHVGGIDPSQAISEKLKLNESNYPVHLSRGSSRKHSELNAEPT